MKKLSLLLITSLILVSCASASSSKNNIKWPKLDTSNSLAGPDLDGNGIRDDIDDYIKTLDVNDYQRKSIKQLALVNQKIVTSNINNEEKFKELKNEYLYSISCFSISNYDYFEKGKTSIFKIFPSSQLIGNTRNRWIAIKEFNKKLSGTVSSPKEYKDMCIKNGLVSNE